MTRIEYKELPQELFTGLYQSELYLKKSGIDLKLLELIKYRVSQINQCAFCLDMHHQEALALGESELRLHSLPAWRECEFYEELEKLALELAEKLTLIHQFEISEEFYQRLKVYYSKAQIASLVLAISQINT